MVAVPLAVYSLAFLTLALYTLVDVWPVSPSQLTNSTSLTPTHWFGYTYSISDEVRILLIVVLVGAIGSFVHSLTSLASYVGNKQFVASWALWYVLRPFIGSALALVIYFAFRGGLINPGSSIKDINLFGIAAISGLAGMFSKEATDKLAEVFGTFFKSEGNKDRKDKLKSNQSGRDTNAAAG